MIGINLECQGNCFVKSKFVITFNRVNKLLSEVQKISNIHGCLSLTLSFQRLTF